MQRADAEEEVTQQPLPEASEGITAMMVHMGEYGWMPMMGFGILFMALFWVVVIVGVVLLVRWFLGPSGFTRGESALEILKKRYARGED